MFLISDGDHKIHYTNTQLQAEALYRVYDNSEIIVIRSGLYFLSSQLSFKRQQSTDTKPIRHKVIQFIYSSSEQRVILEDSKPPCKFYGDSYEFTSNIGALFKFDQNDKLYVVVSHGEHVVMGNHNSNQLTITHHI